MDTNDIRCRIMEEELRTFWPQWHVVKRLGEGAFGDVFQIYKDNYGIRVYAALKVIQIRDALAAAGFEVKDTKDGVTWKLNK